MEEKDNKFHSNPSHSRTFGQYSPQIPASMLAQMVAMKIQEEANKEGSRSSNNIMDETQEIQAGDGRRLWHRTTRNNALVKTPIEVNNNPAPQSMVKRLRMDDNLVKSTGNTMAGPAGQASQST
ncbi:hypothetical protein L195_g014914 [Trifolium pratense]|uniref:Uncharacterized protein n=1 Tax=Trifolium pratense TaxID=57577 RepID=A0A2K3MM04_TRIPR|nr:hypothetical protein L195_g014914 [Trifolium pratense]